MPDTTEPTPLDIRRAKPVYRWSQSLDNLRNYVISDAPEPEVMAGLLRDVDAGEIDKLVGLQQEMEAKDARLRGIAAARRGAVTALDWDVVPETDTEYPQVAEVLADYTRERLRAIDTFPDTLEHLQTAIGPNVASTELIWWRAELVLTNDVPGHRLTTTLESSSALAIKTDDHPQGVPVDKFTDKFIVYHPHRDAGFPFRSTLTHATIWPFIARWFSRIDWLSFSEVYGQPLMYATYEPEVSDGDRAIVNDMLANMGADGRAAFPKGTALAYLQASGTGETYQRQMEWGADEYAIAYLGQTLTTDVGDRGSFAAAKVHDNVRADILLSDLKHEARMIDQQLLRPMCELRFPRLRSITLPVPRFQRLLNERTDIEAANLRLTQYNAAKEKGLTLERDEEYEAVNFTPVEEEEGALP